MYKLYWERLSGAIAPQVLLEEIDADYRKVHVNMAANEHREPAFRRVNPVMRVPALELPDGTVIGETSAITLVLGEQNPQTRLVPMPEEADRPAFLFWLAAMAANGYPIFSRVWHPEQFTIDGVPSESVRLCAEQHLEEFFSVMEQSIAGAPFFLPRGFTALDIYLTMLTEWSADRAALFKSNPRIEALCAAVMERPSYRTVISEHMNGPLKAAD
ncbi:glutathione S-transferase family protein [Zhengella mangrovi]|nr:glutathione S-transferase family protein [Zhengella mangrovi]